MKYNLIKLLMPCTFLLQVRGVGDPKSASIITKMANIAETLHSGTNPVLSIPVDHGLLCLHIYLLIKLIIYSLVHYFNKFIL